MMRRIPVLLLVVGLVVAACVGSDEPAVEGTSSTGVDETAVQGSDEAAVEGTSVASSVVEHVEVVVADWEPVTGETPLACLPMDPAGWWRSDALVGKVADARLAANDEVIVAWAPGRGTEPPVVYHSVDLMAWDRAEFPELTYSGPEEMALDAFEGHVSFDGEFGLVAGGPRGFVSTDMHGFLDEHASVHLGLVVVFSPDGSSWEQVDMSSLPSPVVPRLTGVSASSEGFLIVGRESLGGPLLVWFSEDGRTWSETDLPWLWRVGAVVTVTDSGWAMVSARSDTLGPKSEGEFRVWTSSHGMHWAEIETTTVPVRQAVWHGHLGVEDEVWTLAVHVPWDRFQPSHSPTVWVSTDNGTTWVEHTVWSNPDWTGFQVLDLKVTDDGFLLAGHQDRPGRPGDPFVHHSKDGMTWQHCWTDPVDLTSIEAFGDSIVAFDSGEPGRMFMWREP